MTAAENNQWRTSPPYINMNLLAPKTRAKKRFGQHFLTDRHYIERIIAAIAPQRDEVMVEIGPGPGAITEPLLQKLNHLHAVEIDRDLAAALRIRFSADKFTLNEADVLEFDFSILGPRFRCVGNLPYNISTPFLFHLAEYAEALIDGTFMLQKEVVDRMVADPDDDAYGRLSVTLQYRFAMERLFIVPPGAFAPPPKVDSAIVRMVPLGKDRPRAKDEVRFSKIVEAAFGQRRKMLRNTLKSWLSAEAIEALGIDSTARAETLSVAQFIALADATLKG
jgi:16S rRNA (adenine1518-N6/adenine1519-N6)-dimethyltransferase